MAALRFDLTAQSRRSRARAGLLQTAGGNVETPFFAVVATAGALKGITPVEAGALGARALLVNAYHLHLRPGEETVHGQGGAQGLFGWKGPLLSDSGSHQAFAGRFGEQPDESPGQPPEQRLRGRGQAARFLGVSDEGVWFASHLDGSRHLLTPERSVAIQEAIGADVGLALDQPTAAVESERAVKRAVQRTHLWAARCLAARTREGLALYGVVQGGAVEPLRTSSAQAIAALPFDGVCIGGAWRGPAGDPGSILDWTVPHLPAHWPRHLAGAGEPEDLLACIGGGIDQLSAVTPTRVAREGMAYTPTGKLDLAARCAADDAPIVPGCGCTTCRVGFSRGYLRHLFAAEELLGYTLVSAHNLHFVLTLVRDARAAIVADAFEEFRDAFLAAYLAGDV